jgi:hypothetical protein
MSRPTIGRLGSEIGKVGGETGRLTGADELGDVGAIASTSPIVEPVSLTV